MSVPAIRPLAPTAPGERHRLVDALRGFALLGILVVNIEFLAQAIPVGWSSYDAGYDLAARAASAALFQAKFYLLFSLLFGYGLGIQMQRAARGRSPLGGRYARRMVGLLVLGIAHAVLFYVGDILVLYALVGAVAWAMRDLPTRRLVRIAVVIYGLAALFWLLVGVAAVLIDPAPATASAETVRVYSEGGFSAVVVEHLREWSWLFPAVLVAQGPSALALALVGLVLSRGDRLSNPERHRGRARQILLATAPIGLAGGALAAGLRLSDDAGTASDALAFAVQFTFAPALSAAYVAALMLLLGSRPARALAWMEAAGRMSLTVYLAQSIVVASLVYSYGAGWFGRIGPLEGFALAVGIWFVLGLASLAWLRFARFGPFEWALRSFTYGRLQALRTRGAP